MSCPSQHITHMSFNEMDSLLTFVSSDGFVQRFDLMTFKRRGESFIDRNVEFKSCFFLNDKTDETKVMGVGYDKERGGCLRVYNDKEDVEREVYFNEQTMQV